MEKLPDFKQLSNEAKEALIAELSPEIQKLTAALATTGEAKPNKVPTKTSKNSSNPPSNGFKANIQPAKFEGVKRAGSLGRAGGGRELHPHPDEFNHRPTQKLSPVWRESHHCCPKIAIGLRKNRTTTNSSHHHPNRTLTLWWSVCLLLHRICCTCTIGNGTRLTVRPGDSKLASHIFVTLMPSAKNGCRRYLAPFLD